MEQPEPSVSEKKEQGKEVPVPEGSRLWRVLLAYAEKLKKESKAA